MCGIVGVTQAHPGSTRNDLLKLLSKLEYRGYDSCGYATSNNIAEKSEGKISAFMSMMKDVEFTTGIAHTRWATHGPQTSQNAHPHHNKEKTIFVVHNGIIENYQYFRDVLTKEGYEFITDTDTEVIAHYFDYLVFRQGFSIHEAIHNFFSDAEGTYAILMLFQGTDKIYALKKDSPLVMGIGSNFNILASDIYAFTDRTTRAIFFEDFTYAEVDHGSYRVFDRSGYRIYPIACQVEHEDAVDTGDFPHYMIKEIKEQPSVAKRLLTSLKREQKDKLATLTGLVKTSKRVMFVACGTSHHAGMVGRSVLNALGHPADSIIASEFDGIASVDKDTLAITISQSGETMDVVTVLKRIKDRGGKIAAITNTPYSTIERLSDVSINILAGQEIAVASTKAFTNQALVLLSVAANLEATDDIETVLDLIPNRLQETIDRCEDAVKEIADIIAGHEHVFFLGRRIGFPVALEAALKLKEISYVHAEGQMAAELKHGSIALIDPDNQTPVFILAPNNDAHMMSAAQEVKSRGANTIIISNTDDGDINLPSGSVCEFPLYASVVGQLLAYYTALRLGRDIDQPRNLAKSVTVC